MSNYNHLKTERDFQDIKNKRNAMLYCHRIKKFGKDDKKLDNYFDQFNENSYDNIVQDIDSKLKANVQPVYDQKYEDFIYIKPRITEKDIVMNK